MNAQNELIGSAKEGAFLYASVWIVNLVLGVVKIAPVLVVTSIDTGDAMALVLGVLGTGFLYRMVRKNILKG